MKTTTIRTPTRPRARRSIILLVAATLALGLGIAGIRAALAGDTPAAAPSGDPRIAITPPPAAPVAVTHPVPSVTPAELPPDPNALADGVYPTYVRAVDVKGATVTVDVVQTFFGDDAHRAAIEDGVAWKDVRYDPVYIRNVNPLLRTLPVARDVHIKLIGMCEAPSRWIGLTELREATTPFTHLFYYEVTMVDGRVAGILQKVAVAAC